jgi:hypothetical protein
LKHLSDDISDAGKALGLLLRLLTGRAMRPFQ